MAPIFAVQRLLKEIAKNAWMEAVHVRNVASECVSGQECCNGSTCYDPDTFCGDANNKISSRTQSVPGTVR